MGRLRNHKDAAQEIARDLADIAGQLASLKGEANSWLRNPDYDTLKLRLEAAHAAAEAAPRPATVGRLDPLAGRDLLTQALKVPPPLFSFEALQLC
jgi:hypothetical protein